MPKLNAYKLLLPEQASAVERFAADELDGIFRLCGLPAPRRVVRAGAGDTVISLGETSLKVQYGFTADPNYGGGYNIRTADGHVFIYAPEPSGVINGAYGFAERVVGYRFYAMDEIRVEARARTRCRNLTSATGRTLWDGGSIRTTCITIRCTRCA